MIKTNKTGFKTALEAQAACRHVSTERFTTALEAEQQG